MITATQFISAVTEALWLIPVLTAVGQLIKITTPSKFKRYISLVIAVLGTLSGVGLVGVSFFGAVVGLALGLAATGLYEVGATALAGK